MTTTISFPALQLKQLAPAVAEHFKPSGVLLEFSASATRPVDPGVYVWCAGGDEAILYIGSAARLAIRLRDEERWVREHQPASGWAPSVIHFLQQRDASPHWLVTTTHDSARLLERRLIEWHRTTVGSAPLLTGWAPKENSDQGRALQWARDVWNTDADRYRTWDPFSHPPEATE